MIRLIDILSPSSDGAFPFLMERTIVNAPAIKTIIQRLSVDVHHPVAKAWFKSQLFKHLANRETDKGVVRQVSDIPSDSPDWLVRKASAGDEPMFAIRLSNESYAQKIEKVIRWLNRKFQAKPVASLDLTWEQAMSLANREYEQSMKSADRGQEDTVKEYGDGYRWVKLTGGCEFDDEGERMGNCVGSRNFRRMANNVMSLRSPNGKSHVNVAYRLLGHSSHGDIFRNMNRGRSRIGLKTIPEGKHFLGIATQIVGHSNTPPKRKYAPYIKDLVERLGVFLDSPFYLANLGFFYDGSELHDLKDAAKIVEEQGSLAWIKMKSGLVKPELYGKLYFLCDTSEGFLRPVIYLRAELSGKSVAAVGIQEPKSNKDKVKHLFPAIEKFILEQGMAKSSEEAAEALSNLTAY